MNYHEDQIYPVARVIADGFSEGNESYDEMSDTMRMRLTFAAEAILRNFQLKPNLPNKYPEFASKSK